MLIDNHAFIYQVRQQFRCLTFCTAYGLRSVQRPAAGEDRQPPKQCLLILRKQTITPIHSRPKCLLARKRAITARKHTEAFTQPPEDLIRRESAHSGCGQLQGKWNTIQAMAYLCDSR